MNNKYLKKCIAIILSGAMSAGIMCPAVFAKPDDTTAVTITATAADGDTFFVNEQNLIVESDISDKYGYADSVTDGVSALDALIKMHEIVYGDDFTPETAKNYFLYESPSVKTVFQSTIMNFGYVVNHGYATSLDVKISDGGAFEFFYYQDTFMYGDVYARIDDFTAVKGKEITITAEGYMYGWFNPAGGEPELDPIEDVPLAYIRDNGDIEIIDEDATTDEDGNITITFDEPGVHYITFADMDTYGSPIIPSVTKVTVTNAEVNQSAIAAYNALTKKYADSGLSYGNEWVALGMARGGNAVSDAYYKSVIDAIKNNELYDKEGAPVISDYSRTILALTAMGKNIDSALFDAFSSYDAVSREYPATAAYVLLALNSANGYKLPENGDNTPEKMVSLLVTALGNNIIYQMIDTPAMIVQSLAPYYRDDDDVKSAVDAAFEKIDAIDTTGSVDPCSYAQIIIAYTMYGKDPSVWVEKLMEKYNENEICFNSVSAGGDNDMATEQGYYALAAYIRYLTDEKTLYDMTDAFCSVTADGNTYRVYSPFNGLNADIISANYTDNIFDGADIKTVTLGRGITTFTSSADKVMLWNSVSGMEPLCKVR